MNGLPVRLACAGCGWAAKDDDPYPFRCANADSGDDVDHLMSRVLDSGRVAWPSGDEANPFVRYRELLYSYHLGRAHGMRDADYVELVERLDKAVAGVDGHGFTATPFFRSGPLSERLGFGAGGVWVKDETGNVSGSHKARHLMGLAIHLQLVEQLGLAPEREARPLAIASCGNAALAAAVVARAMKRTIDVYVPTWAGTAVIGRLNDLGARITVCPREEGVPGDPTYHRLQRAIRNGSIPFTCQGPDNGLTIEGGETLAYEIASKIQIEGIGLDAIYVQVGGGALASSVISGLKDAQALGAVRAIPRLLAVQTLGGHPLQRAYDRVRARLVDRMTALGRRENPGDPNLIADSIDSPQLQDELAYARTHRSEFMWPWEEEPKSVATGILDDETYDWYGVVAGMLETAGRPVLVDENALSEANDLARSVTEIDVDHTGSAGLAGVIKARHGETDRVAVLFTGKRRDA